MRLLEQLLQKMMELYEEFSLKKMDLKAIYMFYKCYNLSVSFLGIRDERIVRRNYLWFKYLKNYCKKEGDNKSKEMLYQYISKDMAVIMEALRVLHKEIEESGIGKSVLWENGVLSFPSYEIEEESDGV